MNKKELREVMKETRDYLKPTVVLEKSKKIVERLVKTKEFGNAKVILFYVSKGNEVFTHDLIKACLSDGKRVIVPKTLDDQLELSEISNFSDLSEGRFSILEPSSITPVRLEDIDLVLVPGIAFDADKYRIGYGRGYYDMLLERYSGVKIGLCFECQLVEKIPHDVFDVQMSMLITEKQCVE